MRIATKDAELKLAIAKGKLSVHKNFMFKRTIKELGEMAAETVRQRNRVERSGLAALAQFEAVLKAQKLTYEVEKDKLEILRNQIAACQMFAPQQGKVVYATQQSRRSEPKIIEEGATVFERQPVIKLPDFTRMKVDAKIHESKINLVQEGLRVLIRVDAFPDDVFHGVLDYVSGVPVPGSWPNYDLKEYEAVVRITDSVQDVKNVAELKPGLTAGLQIIVERGDEDVLQVPVQAVVMVAETFFAYVLTEHGPERRDIEFGRTNDTSVEVLAGLKLGEPVILNPRTQFAEELSELEVELSQSNRAKSQNATAENSGEDGTLRSP